MRTPRLRVGDIFRAHWPEYNRTHRVNPRAAKAARHLLACRTAALGGHLYRCQNCGGEVPLYNSCQDRHCPTCQTLRKQQWLQDRQRELLPVEYFHTVFTLPHGLNGLVNANRKRLLDELFAVVHWVLERFAQDPQWRLEGDLGFIALLHTWNQRTHEHFHLHCIVPGGVWRAESGEWIPCRRHYLFGKQPLADAFRNRYLKRLCALRRQGHLRFTGAAAPLAAEAAWAPWIGELAATAWAVWPKPTAAGPEQALDYLGRYTHRVAISDHRLLTFEHGQVTFAWRDRADHNALKACTLSTEEFIRRFLCHILPRGFRKIRFYGWLSARKRANALPAIRAALGAAPPAPVPEETVAQRVERLTGVDIARCPHCHQPHALRHVGPLLPCARAPP